MVSGGSFWFLLFLVDLRLSWWFFGVLGSFFLWFWMVICGSWWFLKVLGGSWWFLAVLGCSWWLFVVLCGPSWIFLLYFLGGLCDSLDILEVSCWLLAVFWWFCVVLCLRWLSTMFSIDPALRPDRFTVLKCVYVCLSVCPLPIYFF